MRHKKIPYIIAILVKIPSKKKTTLKNKKVCYWDRKITKVIKPSYWNFNSSLLQA